MRKLLALTLLVGCQSSASDPLPGPTRDRNEDEIAVRFHMYRNFDLARAIERLLVRGSLDDARALAQSLASASAPPALEAWSQYMANVRERATALAEAPGIDEACRRAAALAGACAGCHAAAGAAPRFDVAEKAPLDQPTLEARMARHRWAADRLWEGMVGNAAKPWQAGLDVLAVTPLPFSAAEKDRVALANRLQQLADRERQRLTTSPAERSHVYGEILVTCAACHTGRGTTPD